MGPKVAELEAELARACAVEHAIAVSSGTAALHLAVLALGIGPGDEVIVPAYTFPATANVVALAGATPVLVDVDPETFNLDPAQVEDDAAHEGDRAGAPVRPPGAARGAARRDDPRGRRRRARRRAPAAALSAGSARAGCLSFHPRKIVTTGEGGAVTTNDDELAERVRSLPPPRLEPVGRVRRTWSAARSTTASPTSSARSGSRRCAGSTSCSPRASASPPAMPSASPTCLYVSPTPTRATATAGRPT